MEELKAVADNLISTAKNWKRKIDITVTGGEPLAKRESFPLLSYLDQKEEVNKLSIITNGLFINSDILSQLSKISKLENIKISLDGASEKTNDLIRGAGTFQKVMKSIELLKKFNKLETILMFTVMKTNFNEIEDIFELCKDFTLNGFIVERFIPIGQSRKIKEQIINKKEWKNLVTKLLSFCEINPLEEDILPYRAFQIKFNPNSPIYQSANPPIHQLTNSPILELFGAPCTAGTDGICIMPNGIVYPCRRFNLPVGNLVKQSLSEIWQNSEVLNKIRGKSNLKGKCKECPIKTCRGCRALAYALTGDYLAEDTQCWY